MVGSATQYVRGLPLRLYDDDTRFWITDEGKMALLELELFPNECKHMWMPKARGVLQCIKCNETYAIRRDDGPQTRQSGAWK